MSARWGDGSEERGSVREEGAGGTLWGPDVAVLLGNDGSLVEQLRSEREGAEKHRVGSLRVVVVGSAGCCAGRMLWRGGGNGTRMRVCVARVVVLL